MWILKKLTNAAVRQYLISEKKCYTVGRKNSDIILDDSSISRAHCVLNVAAKNDCPFPVPTHVGVWVIDKNSKYGTYIQRNHEWVRLDGEQVQPLSNGSIIRFGLMENVWRLEFKPIVACSSRLSTEQTQELKSQLASVDGRLLNKWAKQCTVVVVNDITLTIKVLLALIHGVPIITTNYIEQVVLAVQQNQPLPDYAQYKPKITESTLISHNVSLNPKDDRRELFKGKTFVIPREEQMESLREIIEAAGGCVQLLKLDGNWRKLAEENTIVVQLPCNKIINPDKSAQAFKNLTNVLKNEYHVRVVPETEIYHAIAYSSVEKYCNPKSQAFELRQSSCIQESCGDIIEEETPTQSHAREEFQQPTTSGIKEPEQLPSSEPEETVTSSRKRNHSPEIEVSTKKRALVSFSEDVDLFCESSNDEDQRPTEENVKDKDNISNNFDNLSISRKDEVADPGQKLPVDPDYELDDFWDYDPEESAKSGKRKISTEPSEKNEFEESREKRRRIENSDSEEEKRVSNNEPSPSTSFCQVKEKTVKIHKPKYIRIGDTGNEQLWYRRKNADKVSCETTKPEDIVVNVKRFKKNERYIPPTEPCSEEKTKEIGRKLLMQGWIMSRAARNRA